MRDQRLDASPAVPLANRTGWLAIRAVALIPVAMLALSFLPRGGGAVVAGLLLVGPGTCARRHRVPLAQGFLFAPARPADDFVDLVVGNVERASLVTS